ncbi:hypothetical protein D3C81_1284740 [compost metagenome]
MQAQLGFCAHLAVHAFLLDWCADEVAVRLKCPAMVDAKVGGSVATIKSGDLHASVWADVQRYVDLLIVGAGDDHRVGAHVTDDEIAFVRDLGFMTEKHPCLGEDLFHFQGIQLGIGQSPHLHFAVFQIDQVRDFRAVAQCRIGEAVHFALHFLFFCN